MFWCIVIRLFLHNFDLDSCSSTTWHWPELHWITSNTRRRGI